MKALVFRGKHTITLEEVPMPTIQSPTDAIVKITLCALCGSDMHPYHCREVGIDAGTVCGHEFVGQIHEIGAEIQNFQVGDKVFSPFTTNCGDCYYCSIGLTARCEKSQLFGWVEENKGLHGAQAQFIRVPLADSTLMAVPTTGKEGISDETALLLGDVLSTGYYCAENAGINARNQPVVAVVGCGPVGLAAIAGAKHLGAQTLIAIDSVPERLALAREFGATEVINREKEEEKSVAAIIKEMNSTRGADIVLECVGLPAAFELASEIVRPGGTVSVAGCHSQVVAPLKLIYDKNLTIKSGRCSARYFMDTLLPLLQKKDPDLSKVERIITHRMPLTPESYTLFDSRQDGVIKVIMDPWK